MWLVPVCITSVGTDHLPQPTFRTHLFLTDRCTWDRQLIYPPHTYTTLHIIPMPSSLPVFACPPLALPLHAPSVSGSSFTPLSVPVLPSTLLPLLLLVPQDRACSSLPFLPLSVFLFSDQVKKLCPAPPPRSAARPSGDRRALRRTGAPRRVVSPGSRPQDNKTRSWDSRPDGARGGVRA